MIHDFTYLRPGKLKEALAMLAEHQDECKIICGGQSLLIVMRQGLVVTEYLIDIKGLNELELHHVRRERRPQDRRNDNPPDDRKIGRLLRKNYPFSWTWKRNSLPSRCATGAPSVVTSPTRDAAGDPAPVLIALGATVKWHQRKGERVMPLEEFYTDLFETAMEPR